VDGERIRQALGNLVENALMYGAGDVRMSARRINGTVELHVEDHGPGFPNEFIAHAFERFSRGDAARGRGGAGLGLAIVDAIARGHGGSAHVRNTADGSDVWLELPVGSVVGVPPDQRQRQPQAEEDHEREDRRDQRRRL
jgi:signal transduction histidine kinase